jgi:hypothetical protein
MRSSYRAANVSTSTPAADAYALSSASASVDMDNFRTKAALYPSETAAGSGNGLRNEAKQKFKEFPPTSRPGLIVKVML